MSFRPAIFFVLLMNMLCHTAFGQTIKGDVMDVDAGGMMAGVNIQNIYTHTVVTTDSNGKFAIDATNDQLLEFSKPEYQTIHVRIPKGSIPPYFRIFIAKVNIKSTKKGERNFHDDSISNHELYKSELEFAKLTTLESIQHPFSALSKTNRQIWAFQKSYEEFEQEKYIDYTFNESTISKITGLSGDSAKAYLRTFRPTYQQLRNMKEYDFLSYIKRTVAAYRKGHGPHFSPGRGSGH
ncbi:MAG: hypothetical protein WCG87_09245 [Bacteroidota bacterium]